MKPFQYNRLVQSLYVSLIGAVCSTPAIAQQQEATKDTEVISVIGRSAVPRTVKESPVPVDIVTAEEFNGVGNAGDVTDNLKALIPSYTATPATGDGSAFVRPTSLRGMSPDQTLVLINGKRRHRSALVQFFAPAAGNGSHAPDVGMLPSIAIKNVEVLRDGAAAQYGSDAIAGVINFNLKDADEGGEFVVNYGQHFEGEQGVKIGLNKGFKLLEDGFVNVSAEHSDYEALSRGIQRPDAQSLIDSKVEGIGADSPFDDAPLVQTWGRPEMSGTRLFINSGYELSDTSQLYAHANYANTEGRYRFFYRNPSHGTLSQLKGSANYDANNEARVFKTGYTPYLDGAQKDSSFVIGVKGEIGADTIYDVSIGTGRNQLSYDLFNTTNPALGLKSNGEPAQRDFDVGGFEQSEININVDLSTQLSDTLNFAYGAEWREETYTVNKGEPNSYSGTGSNGLPGIKDVDAGEHARDNVGLYTELEHDISDDLLIQYALRYEDFSDFGDTVNGKVATRYLLSDDTTLRGSLSTGFHAPTPGQANVRTTTTTFGSNGQQQDTVLLPSTNPLSRAYGGQLLKEEESTSMTLGFSTELLDDTNLTLDWYNTEVDDRIYRTQKIDVSTNPIAINQGIKTLSFYTNALDVEHSGVDIVVTSKIADVNLTFAYNYNQIDVVNQSKILTDSKDAAGNRIAVKPVSDSLVEDIENNYPENRFVLSARSIISDNLSWSARATYYGEHYDERGTISGEMIVDSNGNSVVKDGTQSALIDPTVYVDVEFVYSITDSLDLHFGGSNIFNEYVNTIDTPYANRMNVGLPYPRRSPANYEGGSWYLKARYVF